jgi:hypothetical protein
VNDYPERPSARPGRQRYLVELEALGDGDAPAHVRLRGALKCLLRAFRLRCRRVEELPAKANDANASQPHTADGAGGVSE